MLIHPVKLFTLNYNINPNNNIINRVLCPCTNNPHNNDCFEISFNGLFENSTEPVRLDQAEKFSGIHCPACGVKMLSQNDYETIIKKANQIDNAQDFINLLKENQKFIPKHLRQIVEDSEQIENLQKISMPEYLNIMKHTTYLKKQKIVHKIRDDLKSYADWLELPQEQNEKANEIVNKIHTKQNYAIYKNIINEYINFLDLHDDKANQIKYKTLKPVVLANDYYRTFQIISQNNDEKEISTQLASNIFSKSVAHITLMDNSSQLKELPNNKVLICGNCMITKSKNNFMHDYKSPKSKGYIDSYLADIAFLIGHDKMAYSKDYIQAFCEHTAKITRGNICFNNEEIKSLKNLQFASSRHEIFAPIQQSKIDIPCAECGSTMLTHEMRKHIEDEMKDCKTLQDYANLMKKYDKYIGSYARPYANMFWGLVAHDPNMPKDVFLKRMKTKADKYTHRKLITAYEDYKLQRGYYKTEGTPEQLKNYDLFRIYVNDYIKSKSYLDDELITYYKKCIIPLDLEKAPVKSVYVFNNEVKRAILAHRILTDNKKIRKQEDPVYTIVFNIFKTSVATADHLQATSKGGADTKDNLIGLCKTCNRIKSKKDVKTWIIGNKRVKNNVEKQIAIIDKMAKDGQIEGFDNWSQKISDNLYKLSEGKIDLREEFKK